MEKYQINALKDSYITWIVVLYSKSISMIILYLGSIFSLVNMQISLFFIYLKIFD